MDGERRSVFSRLGPLRAKESAAAGQNGGVPAGGPSNRGSHDLKRSDLRHRVIHLSKRRTHHPGGPQHHNHPGQKRKLEPYPQLHPQYEHPPPPPPPKQKLRRRRKKPRVVDAENLDEGEIVDDEDEYEEYDEEEEGEIDSRKDNSSSSFPEGDSISLTSLSDINDEHASRNGHFSRIPHFEVKVKLEQVDSSIVKIKEEFDDDHHELRQGSGSRAATGSDYSDWSDDDNDDLLKQGNDSQSKTNDTLPAIKEEIEESSIAPVGVKNIEDLETISDDDLDPISDDFYDKTTGSNTTDMDDLLNKNDSLSQFPDGTNTTSAASSVSNEAGGGEISVLSMLEIDWKSLINEKRVTEEATTSAADGSQASKDVHADYRARNSSISLLNRIGFSHQFAGPELTKHIERQLAEKLKDQYVPMHHPMPAMHCYYREKQEKRAAFFNTHDPSAPSTSLGSTSPLNGAKICAFEKMMAL